MCNPSAQLQVTGMAASGAPTDRIEHSISIVGHTISLVSVFITAILPIFAITVVGYLLGRAMSIDVGPLNVVALYVFLPALVFHSLATTTIAGGVVLTLFGAVVAFVVVMIVLSEATGQLAGTPEPRRSGLVLASAFPNAGFYGIPVAAFAFGAIGRATAVLYVVVQSFLMYTIGVYVASRGGGEGGTGAVREIARLPLVYAIMAAAVSRWLGIGSSHHRKGR
jgi:predicted permease